MTTTRRYRSTDSGAPALTGQVGSGIAWLKACLVGTGGVAYGSGINEKQAAGWSVAYEDAPNNICVFRSSVAAGGGAYLRVDDNGTGAGGAREMLVRGYATMSGVSTGTDPMPATGVLANGLAWRKSITLDGTSRAWELMADELTLSFGTHPGYVASSNNWGHYAGHFGNYDCDDAGQPYPFVIGGSDTPSNSATFGGNRAGTMQHWGLNNQGLWVMRGTSHAVGPVEVNLASLILPSSAAIGGSNMPIANPTPGSGLTLFQPAVIRSASAIYGRLRGVYIPQNDVSADELGFEYTSPAGLDPASKLVAILQHHTTTTTMAARAHLAIESVLEW